MAKKIVLVDTNVLINAYRRDKYAVSIIEQLKGRIAIRIITAMELYQGCNEKKIKQLTQQLKVYSMVNVSSRTMIIALELIKSHLRQGLTLADAIIAASALENNLELETFNKKDFNFIKGIRFHRSSK
ncbi:MAG: type II toxin-antitoxin system VapC family toxin [Ignavibacteria bacterium]|nr:type II toxin-antitoxin system VapC family toxin [Ignavibacteria bacterium]